MFRQVIFVLAIFLVIQVHSAPSLSEDVLETSPLGNRNHDIAKSLLARLENSTRKQVKENNDYLFKFLKDREQFLFALRDQSNKTINATYTQIFAELETLKNNAKAQDKVDCLSVRQEGLGGLPLNYARLIDSHIIQRMLEDGEIISNGMASLTDTLKRVAFIKRQFAKCRKSDAICSNYIITLIYREEQRIPREIRNRVDEVEKDVDVVLKAAQQEAANYYFQAYNEGKSFIDDIKTCLSDE